MAEEEKNKKRWSVTYTKHIKRKRKVFQDGFLELQAASDSTIKVKLLDECEKLLECRILKDEEAVSSGETLTFSSYLVDVWDPEGGDHKPAASDSIFQVRAKKVVETTPPRPPRQKFRSPSISSSEGRKDEPEKKMAWATKSVSPSRQIVREFKKKEMKKYGAPQSNPDAPKPSGSAWQVLYTTQVTQKAKKYHDGFLRINISGSLGRQVMLSDESRKVLSSRFLGKDEMIQSGESVSFDGYLVEIGEAAEDQKPLASFNSQQNHCNVIGKTAALHGQCKSDVSFDNEWRVLYTTHMTQKAKKYHDGFLRLSNIGSLGRQIMLYDASRKLLESKFLRKDETVKSGKSMAFDAHLVEIGEIEGENRDVKNLKMQRDNFNVSGKAGILYRDQSDLSNNKPVVKGMCQNYAGLMLDTESSNMPGADGTKLSINMPTGKHLRDAHQILSILQKAKAPDCVVSECGDTIARGSSAKGIQVKNTDLDMPEGSQLLGESYPNQGPAEGGDIARSSKTGSKVVSTFMSSQLWNNSEAGNDQSQIDNMEASRKQFCSGMSSSAGAHALYNSDDNKRENFQQLNHGEEMDECPTFDLGF